MMVVPEMSGALNLVVVMILAVVLMMVGQMLLAVSIVVVHVHVVVGLPKLKLVEDLKVVLSHQAVVDIVVVTGIVAVDIVAVDIVVALAPDAAAKEAPSLNLLVPYYLAA
jgi:hypothetical protein